MARTGPSTNIFMN